MKYITYVVPSYNSQDYLDRCVDTLIPSGEDVEIIIVNDGSSDKTAEMADSYAEKYPNIVKVIHKENGGHGSAVNVGLENATGIYFKVVDSDDWVDVESAKKVLQQVKKWHESNTRVDLVMYNYVYDHLFEGKQKSMPYRNVFKELEIVDWDHIGRLATSQYIIMHSTMFRTDVLRESGVVLPEHTFYVDNIFTHQPLSYVKSICYMDLDLYHYFIGREDQSVNEKVLMKRIDQQLKVTKMILDRVTTEHERNAPKKLRKYLIRNLSIMITISDIHLLMINDDEAYAKRKDLWDTIKARDPKLYKHLKYRRLCGGSYLPFGRVGGAVTLAVYRLARKIYKFN
ncbi:MAG: glycosyltransferase family A protein [Acutalibacteraceae bacterium]|nr:glycosyltransferase family A protein [Acutalibacteraceae bacterium]